MFLYDSKNDVYINFDLFSHLRVEDDDFAVCLVMTNPNIPEGPDLVLLSEPYGENVDDDVKAKAVKELKAVATRIMFAYSGSDRLYDYRGDKVMPPDGEDWVDYAEVRKRVSYHSEKG